LIEDTRNVGVQILLVLDSHLDLEHSLARLKACRFNAFRSDSTVAVMSRTASSSTQAQQATRSGTQTLRLHLRRRQKAVSWGDDVVDNEHLNKKSSKKCCIFHKPRAFDESSSDSEDSDSEIAAARRRKKKERECACLPDFTTTQVDPLNAPPPPPPSAPPPPPAL